MSVSESNNAAELQPQLIWGTGHISKHNMILSFWDYIVVVGQTAPPVEKCSWTVSLT